MLNLLNAVEFMSINFKFNELGFFKITAKGGEKNW